MRTWSYAILVIIILLVGLYLQYGRRNPAEAYGGTFEMMFYGAVAMLLPWLSFLAKKYQPLFMMGSFFSCMLAILSEIHFLWHKVYINDIVAVMDVIGGTEFVARFLMGVTLLMNLTIYVLVDQNHRKVLVQLFVDLKECVCQGIFWLMRKL